MTYKDARKKLTQFLASNIVIRYLQQGTGRFRWCRSRSSLVASCVVVAASSPMAGCMQLYAHSRVPGESERFLCRTFRTNAASIASVHDFPRVIQPAKYPWLDRMIISPFEYVPFVLARAIHRRIRIYPISRKICPRCLKARYRIFLNLPPARGDREILLRFAARSQKYVFFFFISFPFIITYVLGIFFIEKVRKTYLSKFV